jgi:DUF1009 family protein
MENTPLGIIAGSGVLPRRICASALRRGRTVYILALEGQTEAETVAGLPHGWFRIGAIGGMLAALKAAGVRDLVMAGKVVRPSLLSLAPDARGAALLARIGFRALGDDGLLKILTGELERDGFRVLSVPEVLDETAPGLGRLGEHDPGTADWSDIARGQAVLAALAPQDVGQAVVVQQGIVLAVEAVEGTDAMLRRAGELKRPGGGGVLVKLAKPQQDDRLDLPVIGPATIAAVVAAGLAGVAVDGSRAILVDRQETLAAADAAGLFVVGL